MKGWNKQEVARKIAQLLPLGSCVNLGIGQPLEVANQIESDKLVFLHSENGLIGMGPAPVKGQEDPDVVNAAKQPTTLILGGSIVHQADSFSLIRGGRLGYSILGALEVSSGGDLANWKVPGAKGVGGVGGAMDLAVGARNVFVIMSHKAKNGSPKLVQECNYPLTALKCVDLVFTELGIFQCGGDRFIARELATGVTREDVIQATDGVVEFSLESDGFFTSWKKGDNYGWKK